MGATRTDAEPRRPCGGTTATSGAALPTTRLPSRAPCSRPLRPSSSLRESSFPLTTRACRTLFSVRGVAEGYDYALRQLSEGRELSVALIQDIHERTRARLPAEDAAVALRMGPVYIRGSRDRAGCRRRGLAMTSRASSTHISIMTRIPYARRLRSTPSSRPSTPFRTAMGARAARLLNCMLVSAGYPPVAIKARRQGRLLHVARGVAGGRRRQPRSSHLAARPSSPSARVGLPACERDPGERVGRGGGAGGFLTDCPDTLCHASAVAECGAVAESDLAIAPKTATLRGERPVGDRRRLP